MILPEAFIQRTQALLGQEFDAFCDALEKDAPVSIRLNPRKIAATPALEKVAWCDTGYYLPSRPVFTLDPLFHAGLYYVQEASSMFLEQVVKNYVKEPIKALDLCAAPGGKSTHLASLLPEGSLLVSNEYVRSRAYILAENMKKWGTPSAVVCNNTPAQISKLSSFFDLILVDAPCSGEGMFRKDEGAIAEWSPENVKNCVARQGDLLEEIWSALREDGILIYSTCTYNRQENEERVQWIMDELGAELIDVPLEDSWGVTKSEYGYRFYPHKTKGEGFFMAVLRKTASENILRIKPQKQNTKYTCEQLSALEYILHPNDYLLHTDKNGLFAFSKKYSDEIAYLMKNLFVLHAGISLGEWKGKSFIPDAGLAFSEELLPDAFVRVEVDMQTALNFLRTENIVLTDAPQGIVLLTYKKHPIGFVKNLGNRCNSL
jgi:16S rRNA C967 or C1407 C5-methylase (RsmB/RsmF family)/NOL1/NOP2/fmu family ribosome biogenesis protein